MKAEPLVLFEVKEGGVAVITLNDLARMNPVTPPLMQGCLEAMKQVHEDHSIRALVLTANGRAFSVGADLAELSRWSREAGVDGTASLGERVADMMETGVTPLIAGLANSPVPVVCAINGPAAGGGVGFALAGDIVLAARSAYFYLPFAPALGAVPDMGASWQLPRAVGHARAMGMTLLGDRISAEQAERWGLIWACIDDDKLADEALRIARRLAAAPAHSALETRALYRASAGNSLEDQLDYERRRQMQLLDGECFTEGVEAFIGKRRPVFPGRR